MKLLQRGIRYQLSVLMLLSSFNAVVLASAGYVLVRDVEAAESGFGRVLQYDKESRAADVLFETAEQPRVVRPGENSVVRLVIPDGFFVH